MFSKTYANYELDNFSGNYKKNGYKIYRVYKSTQENCLIFDNGSYARTIKINNSSKYVFKVNKNSISAIGGYSGFVEFLKKELETSTGGYYYAICKKVLEG